MKRFALGRYVATLALPSWSSREMCTKEKNEEGNI
jgi:hypothetical protein